MVPASVAVAPAGSVTVTLTAAPLTAVAPLLTVVVIVAVTLRFGCLGSLKLALLAATVTTLTGATASNGTVALSYSMRRNSSPLGTYRITSRATLGSTASTATTSFVLAN